MGTFLEGAATFVRGASCPGELRGGSTHDFLPRLMPESFHPSSLPDRPVNRRGKVSSDGCRPSGCRAQVARLLLCACLLSWEKRGLQHHCEVHTRGHRVGDLDIVFSSCLHSAPSGSRRRARRKQGHAEGGVQSLGRLFTASPWRIEAGSPHAPAQWQSQAVCPLRCRLAVGVLLKVRYEVDTSFSSGSGSVSSDTECKKDLLVGLVSSETKCRKEGSLGRRFPASQGLNSN